MLERPFASLFENFFGRDIDDFLGDWKGTQPAVNVLDTKDNYKVEVAVPGMLKDEFDVKLENDLLIISGKKENEKEESKDNYMRKEFSYSSFQRSFHLPAEAVDSEKIEATYRDGILHVTIPKKEEVKRTDKAKHIAIS